MSTTRLVLLMFVLNIAVVLGGLFVNYKMIQSATLGAARPVAESAQGQAAVEEEEDEPAEYLFVPVEKVIVSLAGEGREHYFVLDLVLQAEVGTDPKKIEQVAPMVRSSVVANLSAMRFDELRALPIPQLQQKLEEHLLADFAGRRVATPFQHVLVSKMIVQ
ncbi:flagellar basal body-associated FliL family protein [Pseudomonas sp. Q1-7]|uniref:flagellar basal body-associated FliL family protein n=1 Tax=Pseudomonas sp. Q1-7 TaxID=3020843 RepID=UPI002301D1B2|nr:flagellar basal body-associated FliL family protein [Pseudomonas sp. Q1-7]